MLTDLTPDQRALAEYMSELSEQAIHAGWIQNLEHALWRARTEGPFVYTRLAPYRHSRREASRVKRTLRRMDLFSPNERGDLCANGEVGQ